MSTRIAEAAALSPSSFCKRYRSSYKTSSLSSPTLLVRKRYRGTSEIILETNSKGDELGEVDTEEDEEDESSDADEERENQGLDNEGQGLEDEGHGMEEEEAAPKGQQQAVLVVDTATIEPLGLGYGAARCGTLESTEEITPSTSRVSPSSPVIPSPIASQLATPTATISIDEDQFLEVGAQLELHGSILYDYTQRLDVLPPTLFADIDRDVREMYTRSGAVRDEIFSQRENHDLRMQLSEKRRERLELADHVARMERRQESREE
ncbi:hypothetical protein Tco_0438686 [Tanacetum coccineum]